MRAVARAAALAGGLLLAVLAAGCGPAPHGPAPYGAARGSVQACTAFGVRAIEQRRTPARKPPACQGLSQAEVNFALGRAIYLTAGSGRHKAAWRRAARVAGARLGRLIAGLPPAAATAPGPAGPGPAARPGLPGRSPPGRSPPGRSPPGRSPPGRSPLGPATLLAWLVTLALGTALLGWRSIPGTVRQLRDRRGRGGSAVLPGHFGLASTGLLVWAGYLVTGWLVLGWLAVGLLLPVIGLGMAALALGTAVPARPGAGGGRRAALLPVVHGLAAATTILLALLTALRAAQ